MLRYNFVWDEFLMVKKLTPSLLSFQEAKSLLQYIITVLKGKRCRLSLKINHSMQKKKLLYMYYNKITICGVAFYTSIKNK